MAQDGPLPSANTERDEVAWRHLLRPRIVEWVVAAVLVLAVIAYVLVSSFDDADLRSGQISELTPAYPLGAVPYSLPRAVFIVATTTRLTGCTEVDTIVSRGSYNARVQGEVLRGVTRMTLTRAVEIDPAQRYYLYFDSGSRSKSLDFAVETYGNGTLKTLSAEIRDQVAPIAAATVGGAAALAERFASMAGAAGPLPVKPNCQALLAAMAQNPADPRLVLSTEDRLVPNAPGQHEVSADLGRLARQFDLRGPQWARPNATIAIGAPDAPDAVHSLAFPAPPGCPPAAPHCQARPPLLKGLVLRDAVVARLNTAVCDAACDGTPLAGALGTDADLTPLAASDVVVPQFGGLFLVPVHSGFAQDAGVEVAMSAEGLITKLHLTSTTVLADTIKEALPSKAN